jgi:hypothetical protein
VSTWTPERGLVVIAATDMEDRVEALIQRGKDVVKKQVQLDVDGLKKDIRIALKDAGSRILSVG